MILYPTETIYALGVNAFDERELAKLYDLKGREAGKPVSLLVRDVEDIAHFALLGERARRIAEKFLPGPLTLVLRARDEVLRPAIAEDGTLSFRISPDPIAQQLIADFMSEHNAPLTCTSANVSGEPALSTVPEILAQFAAHSCDTTLIDRIIDDGPRVGQPSTVVRVINDEVTIHRPGPISEAELRAV